MDYFGGLHLTAWNYPFVMGAKKITWRLASLVLTGAPLAMLTGLTIALGIDCSVIVARACFVLGSCVGLCSRLGLVGLMFASLRALPCSAYQTTISWTAYIPHF
ncbi:hypothetical protein HD554DRAFT_2023013 [Boletus coccyginus]|nr:hypothetical protein HD554DRAFT_2023013 [Boletus coccyginus]